MPVRRFLIALCLLVLMADVALSAPPKKQKPLMREFMGLNVHTIGFKPDLYRPICELVRDYHNLEWDVGPDASTPTQFPKGSASKASWLDWGDMYGKWRKAGFRIDVCVQWFTAQHPPEKWGDLPKSAYNYGKSFAQAFGSKGLNIVEAMEIGNEPGSTFPDDAYHHIFANMAKGVRDGDPKMKIATATVNVKGDKYSKPLQPFIKNAKLFDIINVHQYALKTGWPTWERSFPEDMTIEYLSLVQEVIEFRNKNLPGKEIWLTEFGYDASTQPPPATGDFAKWMDVEDDEQARFNVRSFLVFSGTDLDRAYLYFFDDNDEPQFHGSSGITRKFKPKPAYWAVAHLYKTLGEYRFAKAVTSEKDKLFVFDYVKGSDPKEHIFVAWSPTWKGEPTEQTITLPGKPLGAERMPLAEGDAPVVSVEDFKNKKLKITITGDPVYIRVRMP